MRRNKNTVEDPRQVERIWQALAEYGIYSEEDLREAIRTMKPLNIGCMVSKPRRNSETAI